MAYRAGGTVKPRSDGGSISGVPETHSSVTVSPGFTVNNGGKLALKIPHRTVSGEAAML